MEAYPLSSCQSLGAKVESRTMKRRSDPLPPAVRAFFAEKGREGGLLRGKRLSPERRKAIARKAAQARWKKKEAVLRA